MRMGDVLLVTGEGKLSVGLVAAQKLIYPRAISSHVEIGLADGTFVHATSDGGVHIVFILDEIAKCTESWRAIRFRGLDKKQKEEVAKATLYFLRQGYNQVYMGKGTDHSSFCSELVAKAYKKAGVQILGNRLASKTAPAHFDMEADSGEFWEDVTAEYKGMIVEIEKDQSPYRFACQTLQMFMTKRQIGSKMREAIFASLLKAADEEDKLRIRDMVNEVKQSFREGRILNFWDEHD